MLSSQKFSYNFKLVQSTLFRHSPFYSDNLHFNSGNLLHLKFNASAECHLPPNQDGSPRKRVLPSGEGLARIASLLYIIFNSINYLDLYYETFKCNAKKLSSLEK